MYDQRNIICKRGILSLKKMRWKLEYGNKGVNAPEIIEEKAKKITNIRKNISKVSQYLTLYPNNISSIYLIHTSKFLKIRKFNKIFLFQKRKNKIMIKKCKRKTFTSIFFSD